MTPRVHRWLRSIGGRERRIQTGRQPGQIRLRADVELADFDAREPLLRPERLTVDDDTPRVEILDGEIGEQRDAGPERHRAEEFVAQFEGRPGHQIARKQEVGDGGANESERRKADVIEPTVGPRHGAFGGSTIKRKQEAKEPSGHRVALRASFGEDCDERGDGEAERGGDRPEHYPRPAPRSQYQDESGKDHHG